MKVFLAWILFVIGSTAASQSLNEVVDDVIAGVRKYLRAGHDKVVLQDYQHPFAMEFSGQKLPGTVSGSNGHMSNVYAIRRVYDASIQSDGNHKTVLLLISFENLKVTYKNYKFEYSNSLVVDGGVELRRSGVTVGVEISAVPAGGSCSLRTKGVFLLGPGRDLGKSVFTGQQLPEQFKDNVRDWTWKEVFQHGKATFQQHLLNAFQQTLDKSDVDFCSL